MSAATPVDVENRRQMFRRVMQRYQLRPEDVKRDRAQRHVHNLGSFVCGGCGNSWFSAFSWLTLDLRELEIKKWWAMMCQECETLCYPSFEDEQIERMFDIAVQLYKGHTNAPYYSKISWKASGLRSFASDHYVQDKGDLES